MGDEAMKEQLQSTFSEHQQEIKRRSQMNEQGYTDDKTFSKVTEGGEFDFEIADHVVYMT